MHSFVLMICKVQCNIPVLYSRNCMRMWICTWHGSGCQEAISFCRHLSKCMYAVLGSRRVGRVHDKTNSRLWSNAERGPRSVYTFSSSSPRTCIPNSIYSHGLCPAHCRHLFPEPLVTHSQTFSFPLPLHSNHRDVVVKPQVVFLCRESGRW